MKKWLLFFPGFLLLASCQLSPPSLTVKAVGKVLKTYQETYCWQSFGKGECADTGDLSGVIEEDEPKTVKAESEAVLSFWGDPDTLSINREGTGKTTNLRLEDENAIVTLPGEPGIYFYNVHGNWGQGDATYVFQVKIE